LQGSRDDRADLLSLRREYGGLNVAQAKRLKQLEDENGRLKKLVADLSLEKQVLKDIAQGKL
jgi:cell division protein FtsB